MNKILRNIIIAFIFIISASSIEQLNSQSMFSIMDEPRSFWDDVLKNESINSRNMLYAALVAYKKGMPQVSIDTFNECIRRNMANKEIVFLSKYYIGKNYLRMNDLKNAVSSFNSALETDTDKYPDIKYAVKINSAIAYFYLRDDKRFKERLQEVMLQDDLGRYGDVARNMLNKVQPGSSEKLYDDKYKDQYSKYYDNSDENKREEYRDRESDRDRDKDRGREKESDRDIKPDDRDRDERVGPVEKKNNYVIVGLEMGKNFIASDLGKEYKDPMYYKPYLYYNVLSFLAVSLNYETFISSANEDQYPALKNSTMRMWGATGDVHLYLSLMGFLKISGSVGAGVAETEFLYYKPTQSVSKSMDPYMTSSLTLSFEFGQFYFKMGSSYKRVFVYNNAENKYVKDDLYFYSFFGGVGYKL